MWGEGAASRWESPEHLRWLGFCPDVQDFQTGFQKLHSKALAVFREKITSWMQCSSRSGNIEVRWTKNA